MSASSPRSSSATSHVGQYQRTSSVVPQASWRCGSTASPAWRAPQSASSLIAPASSRPSSVSSYR
jgi:hypothetical protein